MAAYLRDRQCTQSRKETQQESRENLALLSVTNLSAGELLPRVVYHYRKHPAQLTRQADYDELEDQARIFAWTSGGALRQTIAALTADDIPAAT